MTDLARSKVKIVVLGVLGLVLITPAIVWAHAELTRSEPAAHSQLATLPTEIRLWFSEEPDVAMTHVVLKDSAGVATALGKPVRGETNLAVRIPIGGALRPGGYTIEWRTVAADDGHPSHGTFGFSVLPSATAADAAGARVSGGAVPPVAPPADTSFDAGEMNPQAPAYVIARALEFASLLMIIGAVAFRVGVLSRVQTIPEPVRTRIETGAAGLAVWSTVLLLVSAAGRLVLQSRVVNSTSAFDGNALYTVAVETRWGHAWHLQVGAAVIALVALLVARTGRGGGWYVAAIAAIILGITPALGGHAAAEPRFTWLAVSSDSLHVVAASAWLGSLACIVLVAIPVALRAVDDGRWTTIASVVAAFSPTALTAAATVAITGTVNAWLRLGRVSALWTSGYGHVLLIKLAVVAAAAAIAFVNWRRIRPRLGTTDATRTLTRTASTELLLGVLILVVTAVLVAMRTP